MFRDIVSNLSLSPAASSQLAFYWRRLRREQLTRQLSMVMAALLMVLQLAIVVAPPTAANAASPNDVVPGGIDVSSFSWPSGTAYPCTNGMTQYSQKRYYLYLLATNRYDLKALLSENGISVSDVCSSTPQVINSNFHSWLSYGRVHQFADDQVLTAGLSTFYRRPLYEWGDNIAYPSLYGTLANGHHFAVLYQCGNLEVTQFPPTSAPVAPTPAPTPTPTPAPTPVAAAPVAPASPATPTPTTPTQPTPVTVSQTPGITQTKSGLLEPANGGPTRDANGATAGPGDTIQYTLTTTNTGSGAAKDYVVSDSMTDVLEYADIINPGGGILFNGSLTWPATTIDAGHSFITTFEVRVKNPIPTTPTSISDPKSYDYKMDDVYGNLVSTNLAIPAQAQVAVASQQLPQTGAGTDTLIVFVLAGAIAYFYFRNRQLITEINLLRDDHYGTGGSE